MVARRLRAVQAVIFDYGGVIQLMTTPSGVSTTVLRRLAHQTCAVVA